MTRSRAIRNGLLLALIVVSILWALQYVAMVGGWNVPLLQWLPGRTYYQ